MSTVLGDQEVIEESEKNDIDLVGVSEEPDEPESQAPTVSSDQADLLAEISNAELRCKKAEWRVMEKKEELKAAKDEFDGCVASLRRLCAQLANDADRPLFNQLEKEAEEVVPDNAWRAESIDVLNLTEAVKEKLRQADTATLGELADLIERCENGNHWPNGIGKATAGKIVDALTTWQNEQNAQEEVPVTIDWESLSHDEQCQYLEGRAARLRGKTADELGEAWGNYHGGEVFSGGADAFRSEELIVNCPYGPTTDGDWSSVDAWIAGWLWESKRQEAV